MMSHTNKSSILKLTEILKGECLTFLICLTLIFPAPLFATNQYPPNNSEINSGSLSKEKISTNNEALSFDDLTPNQLSQLGQDPTKIATVSVHDQNANELNLIEGEIHSSKLSSLLTTLKILEPQLRKAIQKNPDTTFKLITIQEGQNVEIEVFAKEFLNYINTLKFKTNSQNESIDPGLATRFRDAIGRLFEKTSKSDIKWALWRFVANGGASSYAFYLADIPVPLSIALGLGTMGSGSATVGLFIEKYTGWIENNDKPINLSKKEAIYNRLFSIESFMLASPLLIGLQETGLSSLSTITLLSGIAGLTVTSQNIYRYLRDKYPSVGYWYKWGTTEALFVALPPIVMPLWGLFTDGSLAHTIIQMYITAILSLGSQGLWDIAFTNIRKPFLKEAIEKDVDEIAERIYGKDLSRISKQDLKSLLYKYENQVREKYKSYFFIGSVWSVGSAILRILGTYNSIPSLELLGSIGFGLLGVSGAGIWIKAKLNQRKEQPANPEIRAQSFQLPTSCSLLFK